MKTWHVYLPLINFGTILEQFKGCFRTVVIKEIHSLKKGYYLFILPMTGVLVIKPVEIATLIKQVHEIFYSRAILGKIVIKNQEYYILSYI